MKKPNFNSIPQLTHRGNYAVNVGWDYLEQWLESMIERGASGRVASIDLDPDFQRGYVWTEDQKSRYVEYILRGGRSGRDIYFNCVGWSNIYEGPFVIVDGKQRLDAVRAFLADKVLAFGHRFSEFEGKLRITGPDFVVHVNDLKTRAQVLQWYLEMNAGGTVHTTEELERVRGLLEAEKK